MLTLPILSFVPVNLRKIIPCLVNLACNVAWICLLEVLVKATCQLTTVIASSQSAPSMLLLMLEVSVKVTHWLKRVLGWESLYAAKGYLHATHSAGSISESYS